MDCMHSAAVRDRCLKGWGQTCGTRSTKANGLFSSDDKALVWRNSVLTYSCWKNFCEYLGIRLLKFGYGWSDLIVLEGVGPEKSPFVINGARQTGRAEMVPEKTLAYDLTCPRDQRNRLCLPRNIVSAIFRVRKIPKKHVGILKHEIRLI